MVKIAVIFLLHMSELARAFLQLGAVPMLLKKLAHRHAFFHHSMEEITFFIRFTTATFHPESADFLLTEAVVCLVVY